MIQTAFHIGIDAANDIRLRLRNTWNAFFARFGKLRPVQRTAILPILDQRNVLVTAPKTEAVVATSCQSVSGSAKSTLWRDVATGHFDPTEDDSPLAEPAVYGIPPASNVPKCGSMPCR